MSEAISNTTHGGRHPPFSLQVIDFEAHPDGLLLRLCACLGRMRSATMELWRRPSGGPLRGAAHEGDDAVSGRHIARRDAAAGGMAMRVLAAVAAGQTKAAELDGELCALVREFKDRNVVIDRLTTVQDEYGWRGPEGQRAGDEISLQARLGNPRKGH
jgi:hypothetical protein